MAEDLTIEILKQIRDGIGELRTDLRTEIGELRTELRTEMAGLHGEMVETNERLERVESGLRDLGGYMRGLGGDQARHERWLTEDVKREFAELKERVARLEAAAEQS
jgi:predicted nuclease with TOPRIM domain